MASFSLEHLPVAVVGAGRSGRAALRLLHEEGASVRLLEKSPENMPEDFSAWLSERHIPVFGGEHVPAYFEGVELVIPSPAAAKAVIEPLLPLRADGTKAEIMAETELAWRLLEGEPVVGVTGTSGKTTTTSIISAMLKAHGLCVFTGGNIGVPLSEYVLARRRGEKKADVIVLELSSFQLQTCSTLRPRVGVLLNISENHLDFHKDMEEYTEAKMRLFVRQTEEDTAILSPTLRHLPEKFGMKARVLFLTPGARPFPETRLIGAHNQSNAEAAFLAASAFGVTKEEAARAMREFTPIAHRLEHVADIAGVQYVNDSKCTTIEALKVALCAFERPVILLAGGKFKGGDVEGMKPLLAKHVRAVVLYGASREHFEPAWKDTVPVTWDETMDEALARARSLAREGDAVLLAPATSSYDQYRNYMERGGHFRTLVLKMKEERP
ncbi:UDP-N-acetylmuramoyl-L-alanine--D-glutamate ligase [Mailhella massiliensis]|uniref:UDP-N-acetylmuramoylalanine--D-glutamate ligase n=1 Tax=Mailhella massiliensis TaxID=1903261 RepID=A0A921ATW0_9BACT|nr:UDP-N-acetylmuramoyl-L-alanine--D-glutamate ligase [Mailhella massiliensis]HJD96270.1 UDP-N-acetylmuramoyl-L-alanine--D-glutamate ligase [Mailhella massiliensis]